MKNLRYTVLALMAFAAVLGFEACKKTEAPVPDFSASSQTIFEGEKVDFKDLSTNEPTEWQWSFEGGTPFTSSEQNPSGVLYSKAGTYSVSLTATNEGGSETKTTTSYITVQEPVSAPVADFSASKNIVSLGERVAFTDLSTNNPASWKWTFQGADPSTSTEQNPSGIRYNVEGSFLVTLEVFNAAGSDLISKSSYITVAASETPPVVDFEASEVSIEIGETVDFTDYSSSAPTAWLWTFEGGSPYNSTVQNPSKVLYEEPGTFAVSLTATNAYGSKTGIKTSYITVASKEGFPEPDFSASATNIQGGTEISFTDLSKGNPTSWNWTFEGATPETSSSQNPSGIRYQIPGTYNVSLRVSNSEGSIVKTKTGYITVQPNSNAPVVDFSASSTTIFEGESIDFTDLSSNNPTSWSWTFEGATPSSSNDINPGNIQYNTVGTYSVTLQAAKGEDVGKLTKTAYITVKESPLKNMKIVSNALAFKSSGTKCPPCGGWGWNVWSDIISTKSNMIPFTIHSANFVSQNYINEESNDLDDYLSNSSWPGFFVGGAEGSFWKMVLGAGATEESITRDIKNNIDLATTNDPLATAALNYEISNGTISVTSYVGFLKETTGNYYVSVWVSEDDVYGPQSGHPDGNVYHKKVLRTATDNHSVFGVPLASGTISANTLKTTKHTATFESGWNQNNINVAVIVWKRVGNSYRVVNASSEIFTP